jgi:hypothetical protein
MKKFAGSSFLGMPAMSILAALSVINCARAATDLPAGTAKTREGEKEAKLDVTFHAALK